MTRGLDVFSLAGRRVLVTGGNRGLGFAFAKALGECGATVAFACRDATRNAEAVARLAAEESRPTRSSQTCSTTRT